MAMCLVRSEFSSTFTSTCSINACERERCDVHEYMHGAQEAKHKKETEPGIYTYTVVCAAARGVATDLQHMCEIFQRAAVDHVRRVIRAAWGVLISVVSLSSNPSTCIDSRRSLNRFSSALEAGGSERLYLIACGDDISVRRAVTSGSRTTVMIGVKLAIANDCT